MGVSFVISSKPYYKPKMRSLLFVALAVAAVVAEPEAEANADPYYGYYGYGLGYGYPFRYGYGHRYYGYPNRFGHFLGKREAEADPAVLSTTTTALPHLVHLGYLGHPGLVGPHGYYGHPWTRHHGLPVVSKVVPAAVKPAVEVPAVEAVVDPKITRVLNAPYGVPYRYGPTVPGVGPKADAFGRRY